ncbi:MAG: hypothetical protein PPP58_02885 [Natronomonas sp.]
MDIVDTLTLFGAVALAAPIAMLGVEFVVGGRTLAGIGFLAVAAGLIVGQQYGTPSLKRRLAGTAVDAVVDDDTETTEGRGG